MPHLTLIQNEIAPSLERLVIRMQSDVLLLRCLPIRDVKAIYNELEELRDALSKILDKADGKR